MPNTLKKTYESSPRWILTLSDGFFLALKREWGLFDPLSHTKFCSSDTLTLKRDQYNQQLSETGCYFLWNSQKLQISQK